MAGKATTSKNRRGFLEFRVRVLTSAATEVDAPAVPKAVNQLSGIFGSLKEATLYYTSIAENSDKVYIVRVELDLAAKNASAAYKVTYQYGKRDAAKLTKGTRTPPSGVSAAEASRIFDALVDEKKAKGYTTNKSGKPFSK